MFAVNSVILPDPELGNSEAIPYTVQVQKARSGKRTSTVKTPAGKELVYTFLSVPLDIVTALKLTISNSPNFIVQIFDHHDRQFDANVLSYKSTNQSHHEDRTVNLTLRKI